MNTKITKTFLPCSSAKGDSIGEAMVWGLLRSELVWGKVSLRERERVESRSLSRCFRDDFYLENNLPRSERGAFYYWGDFNKLKALFCGAFLIVKYEI